MNELGGRKYKYDRIPQLYLALQKDWLWSLEFDPIHGREKEEMTLKDRLKGREKQKEEDKVGPTDHPDASPPNFTFLRTTTHFQEQIQPPSYAGDAVPVPGPGPGPGPDGQRHPSPRRLSRFRSASNASSKSVSNKGEGRLSSILHIRSHSRESNTSINVPTDLPEIGDCKAAAEDQEAQWEERATILAQQVAATRSRANTIAGPKLTGAQSETDLPTVDHRETRPGVIRHVSDALSDVRGSTADGVGRGRS